MATPEQKLSLEVLVDSKTNKVLLAEANSDFVDVLFSFLTLPLGTIIRQLNTHCGGEEKSLGSIGCLNNLYASASNLSTSSFFDDATKMMILYPRNAIESDCNKLKLKIDDREPLTYSKCQNPMCVYKEVLFIGNYETICCGKLTNYVRSSSSINGVFTAAAKSFIITDDLRVSPVVDGANLEPLKDLVSDDHSPEHKTLNVGLKEIMHLLKWSFFSTNPLTNLLLWQLNPENIKNNYDYATMSQKNETALKAENSRTMVVGAVVQKSTNKLLFVVAGPDFIEFLFRFLTIPLGAALSLLGGKSGFWSIDELYKSISDLDSEWLCLHKSMLINPQVAHRHIKSNTAKFLTFNENPGLHLMDLIGDKTLIKSPSKFMVTDNLEVTSLSYCASIIPHLLSRNIPISDVKEVAFDIGEKEALDILRETLTSLVLQSYPILFGANKSSIFLLAMLSDSFG